jgi:hypothetical protein
MRDIQQAQQGGVFQSVPSQSVTIDTGEGLFAQGGKEIHISVCWVENHVGSAQQPALLFRVVSHLWPQPQRNYLGTCSQLFTYGNSYPTHGSS